jgi:hypothetical protein
MRIDRRLFRWAVLCSFLCSLTASCDEESEDSTAPDDESGVLDEVEQQFDQATDTDVIGTPATEAPTDEAAAAAAAGACAPYFGTSGATSAWARVDASGKLAYKTLPKGDRIMDFSYAGYGGGGVKLPELTVRATVRPRANGGDDTAAIQAALDTVSARALANGVRGAVLLERGTFHVSGTLEIHASGVVLRGRGAGPGDTVIMVTGGSHRFLEIKGTGSAKLVAAPRTSITDAYVASGSATIHVQDASGFAVGDAVMVTRPVTAAWVALLGMDLLVRHDKPQTWIKPGTSQRWERSIRKIQGNTITLDIPLSDSLDRTYVSPPAGSLQKFTFSTRISRVGVEHLRVVAPLRTQAVQMNLLDIDAALDAWVRDLTGVNFTNGIGVGAGGRRVTIEDVELGHDPGALVTSAAPADFSVNGQQVLVQRCASTGGNKIWYGVTHNSARGPNVFLDFTATGQHSHFAPHQRWATGLLVDRAEVEGGIALSNLGTSGSGHGWTIAWGVLWNCVAGSNVQQPAGATNWAIGCKGAKSTPGGTPGMPGSPPLAQGIYDSHGHPVIPESLYLAQLCQRLGPGAVANIGY